MSDAAKSGNSVGAARPPLTRKAVASRLGVSVSAVRRMEGKTLFPVRDEAGVWRFSEAEVSLVPTAVRAVEPVERSSKTTPTRSDEGELAALIFQAFAAGAGLRQIVTRLRVTPAKVRELYSEWQVDLVAGEQERRERGRLAAEAKEQREEAAWMRALRHEK